MAKRDRFAECVESSRGESDVRVLRADLKWAIKEVRRLRKLVADAAKAEPAPVPSIVTYEMAIEHMRAGGVIDLVVFGGQRLGTQRKGVGSDSLVRTMLSCGEWSEWRRACNDLAGGMSREPGAYALLSGEGDV